MAGGGRAHHDRARRAALFRRVLRRSEDGGPRSRRARHGAGAPRCQAHRPPSSPVGGHRRQPDSVRHTSHRPRHRRRLRPRRDGQPRAADRRRFRGRSAGHAPRSDDAVPEHLNGPSRGPFRSGHHHQLRFSAGPESLSGRQGNVRGRRGRGQRWPDHLCRRVPPRVPRLVSRAARFGRVPGRDVARHREPYRDGSRPVGSAGSREDPLPSSGRRSLQRHLR